MGDNEKLSMDALQVAMMVVVTIIGGLVVASALSSSSRSALGKLPLHSTVVLLISTGCGVMDLYYLGETSVHRKSRVKFQS